jgi:diguanylate cyclase (GGDEF)-like protein
MIPTAKMLLLADPAVGQEFTSRLGPDRVQTLADPYDALEALSRRPWPVVVVAAPQPDFAGLCRACRRLQRDAVLLALCPPAAEPEVRPLTGETLDDYLIAPLTRRDWANLKARADAGLSARQMPRPPAPQATPEPHELADLISSATTPPALQERLAALVARRLGREVRWLDADTPSPQQRTLLTWQGPPPRLLCAAGAPDLAAHEEWLEALQVLLGPLAQAAGKTAALRHLAITDHLTGAYNRRYFYHVTDHILRQADSQKFHVTLLLYDIDDFKRYNDTYGHAVGDEILRQTAALMKRITRQQDIVARIGGDEFAVLFWDTAGPRSADSRPPETAYALADRFRKAVETQQFPCLGPVARGLLSISGGLATFPAEGRSCRQLLSQADRALRAAKSAGKNQIYLVGQAL